MVPDIQALQHRFHAEVEVHPMIQAPSGASNKCHVFVNTWLPVYGETGAPAESHTHTTLYQTNVHPFGQAQTGPFADKRAQAAVSHHFQTREQTVNETGDHLQTIPANQHSRSNESHLQSDLHQMISSADTGEENYGKKLPRPKSRWDQMSRVSDGEGSSVISKLKTSSTLPVTELPQECLNIPLCDVGHVSGQILDTQTFKVLTESSNPLQSKAHVFSSQQCMSNLYPQSPSATNSSGNSSSITNMDTLPGTGFYFKAFSTMPALSTVTRPSSVSHIPASSTEERPCFSNLTTPPVSILSFEALPTVQLFFPACPTVSSPHSSVQSNDPPLTTSRCRHPNTAMLLPDSVPLTSSHLSHPGHSSENVTKPQTQHLGLNTMQMQLNNPMSVTGSHSLNINPSTLDNKSPNQSNTPMSVIEPHALNMMLRTSENPGQSYPDNTRAAEQLLSGNVNIKTHQTGSLSVIMDQNNTSEKGKVSFDIRHHKCLDQNSLNVGGAFSSHQGVVSDICKDQKCLEEGTVLDINKRPLMDKRFEDSSYRKTENVLEAISLSEPLETKSYTKEADDERDELTRGASHEVQDAADEGISSRVNDWQLCTSHNVQDSSVVESKMSLLDGSLPSLLQVEGTGEFPGTLDAGQTDRHCPCEGEGDNEALPINNTNGTTEKKVNSDSREPGYSSNYEESCARVRHHLRDKGRINRITVMKPDFNNTEMIDVVSVTPDEVCQIREDVANIRCIDVESSTSDTAVKSTQQMLQTVTDEPHKRKRMSTDDCKRLNKKRKSQKHDLYQPPCYNGKLTSELTRRCSGSPIGRRSAGSEIPSGETRSKQPCSVPVECVQRRRSTRLFIKSSLSPQFDGSSLRQRCTSIPSGIGCGRSDSNCTGHCTDPSSMEGHRRRSTRLVIKESIVQECVRASEIQLQRKEINQNSVKDLLSDKETTSSQNLMFYVCGSTCGFSSLYGDELKKHVLECTLPGSLDCYHCGFKARDNDALVAHVLNHSDRYENLHKCSVPDCKFETNVLHSYQTHLQETHPQLTRYVCHDCDSVYNDMDDLVQHVHDNLRLIVWCKYCDAIACDERLILDHIQKVHQKSLGTWTMNDLLCGERKAFAKSSSQLKWNPYVRMRRLHRSISDGVETSDVSVEDVDMVSFLTEVENDTLQGSFVNSSTENIIP